MTEPIKDKSVVKNIMKSLEGENQRNAIMFGLGIYCGFRISDILNLKVKEKTGKMINIPLNRELKKLIDEYTEEMKDDDYLIKSRKGINKPITRTQAYRIMKEIEEYFNIENLGCHGTRKTFAYWLYMDNKKDIGLVQKALGHQSSATTLAYIGMDTERLNNAIKKIKY